MTIQERQITATEFWQLAEQNTSDGLIELINGEMIDANPPKRFNSALAARLIIVLGGYASANKLGIVLGADGGFTFNNANVRPPDVSFVAKDRIEEMNIAEDTHTPFAPDLAVEVISPSESARAISEKTNLYLSSGVKLVWNVYPDDEKVEVWTTTAPSTFEVRVLLRADTLTGDKVLPDFTLKLTDLFAPIDSF